MKRVKKMVSILLAVLLTLSVVDISSINVVAEESSSVIQSGTPMIDGQVDDSYKASLKLQTGTGANALGGAWDDATGDIYFLYDADYLYICADITDNDVFSKGELYVQNSNPWQNDCCEFRLSLDGGTTTIKVGIDAFGYRAYGLDTDMEKIDYSKILYKTTYVEEGSETGYVIEAAIPCTGEYLDMITAEKLGFKLQLNDLDGDGNVYSFATDYAGEGAKGLVYYNLSGDVTPKVTDYKELSFASDGNYYILSGSNYGVQTMNAEQGTVDISYGATNYKNAFPNDTADTRYMVKAAFNTASDYDVDYKYLRVLYSAQNPEGVESTEMRLWRDGKNDASAIVSFTNPIVNTNGTFVLSDTVQITDEMASRWVQKNVHNSLMFMTTAESGSYQVKSFYFFKTVEDANNFVVPSNEKEIKINGNDISNYRIVLSEDPVSTALDSAGLIKQVIYEMTGEELPIVYDNEAPTDYEILIGNTNRTESLNYYGQGYRFNPTSINYSIAQYRINRVGNKLLLLASTAQGIEDVAELFVMKLRNSDSAVDITESTYGQGMISVSRVTMSEVTNVEEPFNFKDDFDTDEGYWTTDSDKISWEFAKENTNNILLSGSTYALSYLHVFEKNVSFEADMKYTSSDNGTMGMVLRYTSDHAYVKVGYDFAAGEWFIDTREGEDYVLYRIASKAAEISAEKWYKIKAVIDGKTATLYVDGEEILSTSSLTQLTPGKIGVFSKGVSVKLDNADIYLLSGQGTIMRNVVHTKLPDEEYREGGTVWEMNDGSLTYEDSSGATFVSNDSGKSWTRADKWTETYGYPNILRLENGSFLKIATETIDGVGMKTAQISTNEGETWTTVGNICASVYQGISTVKAGNMNDKLTQMSDGRIFYSQNYQSSTAFTDQTSPVGDGTVQVFCEIYYSDNNGSTWTRSETLSYEIPDNTEGSYFGECKVLETAEGKLRIYNSWNTYGCIVYSESNDNGQTWGPLQKMEDFKCVVSSMQFVKDNYADNDTTYYMVWVNTGEELITGMNTMPRSRLTLAKSTDGINWEILGDIWRWESRYSNDGAHLYHIVNPFITVTDDYLIVGSGISEKAGDTYHQAQRQHIYSILKNTLEEQPVEAAFGNLIVTNTVAGNAGSTTKDFAFTVTLDDISIDGTYGEMTFANGISSFNLKHGESKTATDLPNGVMYTVTETDYTTDGYVTTKNNDTGTIAGDNTNTAAFINTKNIVTPDTVSISVKKVLRNNLIFLKQVMKLIWDCGLLKWWLLWWE